MSHSTWGESDTQFFFSLTPEKVLAAVESGGLECTGRCMALGSFENRVYEVELEIEGEVASPADRFRVAKFYRPGRWSREQIQEEHDFLAELQGQEIPVIAPERFSDGSTLRQMKEGIFYTLFPKRGGRAPDELNQEQLERIGRLLARIHNVGAVKEARHRVQLTPASYGISNLKTLLDGKFLPPEIEGRFKTLTENICQTAAPWFEEAPVQRIHGDCHLGNLLWNDQGPFFLDFDDMVTGPPVQDPWLVVKDRDSQAVEDFRVLISAYDEMRTFDYTTLRLIEPLRALRVVHFVAWIAKRWDDPAFQRAFSFFGSPRYWQDQIQTLEEQSRIIESGQYPWLDIRAN